jgi:hypothetical protein
MVLTHHPGPQSLARWHIQHKVSWHIRVGGVETASDKLVVIVACFAFSGSPLGKFEQESATQRPILQTVLKGGTVLNTPMPGGGVLNQPAYGGAVATIIRRDGPGMAAICESLCLYVCHYLLASNVLGHLMSYLLSFTCRIQVWGGRCYCSHNKR